MLGLKAFNGFNESQLEDSVYNQDFMVIIKGPNGFIATCHLHYDSLKYLFKLTTTWKFYAAGISSLQFSHSVVSSALQPYGRQHSSPPCSSPTPRVGDGQGGLACCSPWGRKESDMTELN